MTYTAVIALGLQSLIRHAPLERSGKRRKAQYCATASMQLQKRSERSNKRCAGVAYVLY